MEGIKKFMNDRNSVNALTTLVIFVLGIHFFFIGFLEVNLLFDLFGLGSYSLYRVYAILISLGFFFLALSLYLQNKKIVDQAVESTSKKIREEASEITQKVEKQIENLSDKEPEKNVEVKVEVETKEKKFEDFTKV